MSSTHSSVALQPQKRSCLKSKRKILYVKDILWTIRLNCKRYGEMPSAEAHTCDAVPHSGWKAGLSGLMNASLVCGYQAPRSPFSKSVWGFSASQPQPVKMIPCNTSLLNPISFFFSLTQTNCLQVPA